jgi:epoxyqueuosine reductase|tara:strand:+ start:21663 stop:22766 length:1104 start_codon:yes stop_codon:yes gene_type:complete
MTNLESPVLQPTALKSRIRTWAEALGFQNMGVTGGDLTEAQSRLLNWLTDGCHGEMSYMARYGELRSTPWKLVPGTIRVISVRMDYLPSNAAPAMSVLSDKAAGYISRYALGRDYHKLVRRKLQRLADRITEEIGPFSYRAFADSAPVLEKPLAAQAGLGWLGKHTNLIDRKSGSWFFLGELYTDLPLPVDTPQSDHCGECTRCIEACPTGAIDHPYHLDARRCISYLTIELAGSIPVEFRHLIGNRIFGCDDCQLVCPWNRFAKPVSGPDFQPRHSLDWPDLLELFSWSETEFLHRLEGSPIRRIGHQRWQRNIAVALGNGQPADQVVRRLRLKRRGASRMLVEHIDWSLQQLTGEPVIQNPQRPT